MGEPPIDRDGNLVCADGGATWLACDERPDIHPASATEAKWAAVAKRPRGEHDGDNHVKEARGVKLGFKR
eukprot:1813777-Pyramimonas_sp.AAC.1